MMIGVLTPTQVEAVQRSRAFHARIAEQASRLIVEKRRLGWTIPNTPYGVPKIAPSPPRPLPRILMPMEFYYEQMWFADLINFSDRPRVLTIVNIQEACCRHFRINVLALVSA